MGNATTILVTETYLSTARPKYYGFQGIYEKDTTNGCISKVQETRTGGDIVCAIIVWKIWLDKDTSWSTVIGSIRWAIGIGGENIRNQWPDKEI